MSNLAHWNSRTFPFPFPSPTFRLFDELNRHLDLSRTNEGESLATGWVPPVDIFEDADGVTLEFDLPNFDPAALDIRVENGTLTVKGERKLEREEKRQNYQRVERFHGTFSRQFTLPTHLDAEKVAATSKNGVLKLFLPRREESKPKSIKVAVN